MNYSSDDTLEENATADTRAVQMSVEDYTAFQAFQTHRRQASLSFETQGAAKRPISSLKMKDPVRFLLEN